MDKLQVAGLNFYYGDKLALADISMVIRERQITALIGPSGCGKSTFLRCLNRMNDTIRGTRAEGRILLDGDDIYAPGVNVVDLRRRVGMVFQRPNPFPQSIFANVAFGPRVQGAPGESHLALLVEESLRGAGLWEFGDVLSVSTQSLWLILIFGGLVLLAVFSFYKEFTTLSFDPVLAATLRLPVGLLNNLLLTLIAVTVAVSLQTVGVALMVAMLVTPAATAYLLTHRLSHMMLLAAVFASFSGVIGLYLSFYLSIASGAAIVLTATFFFVLAFGWKRMKQK